LCISVRNEQPNGQLLCISVRNEQPNGQLQHNMEAQINKWQ